MSYKWPDKDPDETIDYSVDWSRFIPNGLQFVQPTLSGKVATARFALGTNNKRYTVTCQITTGAGLVFERSIFLKVKEK